MNKAACLLLSAVLLSTAFAGFALASGEGQKDLDQATEKKLSIATMADFDEVIRLAESALKKGLDPASVEFANNLLASTYFQRAQAIFDHYQNSDQPIPPEGRVQLVGDLTKTLALNDKQPRAHLMIARFARSAKSAEKHIEKAIEYGDEDPPTKAKALAVRGSMQEKPEKKLADFDEAIRLAPENIGVLRARGLTLAELERNDAALADLSKALEMEPDHAPTLELKGQVLGRLKRYDEAIAALEKAKSLVPTSSEPLLHLAQIHALQKKFDAAIKDLAEALEMDESNVGLLLLRASIYQEKGDKEKAMADADKAVALLPNMPLVIRTRAILLAENERYAEAISDLEKILRITPGDTETLMQLAMVYSAQKKSDKAVEIYGRVLKISPEQWRAFRGRGDAYLNLGRHAEAIADYEKALKLQPKDDGILNNLAWVLCTSPDDKLRDGRRAVKLAKQACELTEYKAPHILSTLAAAHAEAGDFESAKKWSLKAIELTKTDKDHPDDLKKELENYKVGKPTRELLTEGATPAPPAPKK
jgi:tetratricopeptide (TPR) repeat protein